MFISRPSQCSAIGVTKEVICTICLWVGAYKRSLAASQKE